MLSFSVSYAAATGACFTHGHSLLSKPSGYYFIEENGNRIDLQWTEEDARKYNEDPVEKMCGGRLRQLYTILNVGLANTKAKPITGTNYFFRIKDVGGVLPQEKIEIYHLGILNTPAIEGPGGCPQLSYDTLFKNGDYSQQSNISILRTICESVLIIAPCAATIIFLNQLTYSADFIKQ